MTLQHVIILALQASIFLIVLGLGLKADAAQARLLFQRPRLLGRSILAISVVMPIVAMLIVSVLDLRHAVEIVLVALAIAPIPPLLPGKEGRAGGNTAYGVVLMAIMALLAIVIVPMSAHLIGWVFHQPFAMPPSDIARTVLVMVLLPLVLGMSVRKLMPGVANRIARPLSMLATGLLLLAVLAVLPAALPAMWKLVGEGTLLALAAFVLVGLSVGHVLGGPVASERTVLALSTASRHPAIALAIAKANFPDEPLLAATVVLYLLVATLIVLPYVMWRKRAAAAPP